MTDFTGHILELDSDEVMYAQVRGNYTVKGTRWSGHLTIESGERPMLFDGRLVTDDGLSGRIVVRRLETTTGLVLFDGHGAPPKPYP